jgi:dTDP-4-amino-4,6-dideoxygalactose transaminase
VNQISISSPCFGTEEYEAIQKPLKSGWVTQGEYVRQFEESFAKLHNVKYAIATTSCTTALHLMLIAGGIKPGDEVIVPSFTWVSTANAVRYCGANPVFADINLDTFNLDINDVIRNIIG